MSSTRTTAKLFAVVLACGVTAASLLVMRHERLEMAHEMTQVYDQIRRNERTLWDVRRAIAERCHPEAVERMLADDPDAWHQIPAADATGAPRADAEPPAIPIEPAAPPGPDPLIAAVPALIAPSFPDDGEAP
jgi:hypothetical protein